MNDQKFRECVLNNEQTFQFDICILVGFNFGFDAQKEKKTTPIGII